MLNFLNMSIELPSYADEIRRLESLSQDGVRPAVVVLGKYNHGKSSLLNALLCKERFRVSDVRETVAVEFEEFEGVKWVDTPGLDADVAGEDDRKALSAVREHADIRLMVHHLREGELDSAEQALASSLLKEMKSLGRPSLLVLTKREELDAEQLGLVMAAVERQVPGLKMVAVSAESYVRGLKSNKAKLIESSNFGELRSFLQASLKDVPVNRRCEQRSLIEMIASEHKHSNQACQERIRDHKRKRREAYAAFADEFRRLRIRIDNKLKEA